MKKRFRLGRWLFYQHDPKFLFWANDLCIRILWGLHIEVFWKRTFVWSDDNFSKWTINIFWFRKNKYKKLYSPSHYGKYKKNTKDIEKYRAEEEMENYYSHM